MSSEATTSSAASSTSSATTTTSAADCGEDSELEETPLATILENGESALNGTGETFKDIEVDDDSFDPCAFLSYAVLKGTFDGDDAKALVVFKQGEIWDEDMIFLTDDSLEVTEKGEGFAFTSEGNDVLTGVEGDVKKREGSEQPMMNQSFSGSQDEILFLQLDADLSASSAELGSDEEDMRGESAVKASVDGLELTCLINESSSTIDCGREDGETWALEGDVDIPLEDFGFEFISAAPLEGDLSFGGLPDDFDSSGAKELEKGLYRIGKGNIEGQLAVLDDGIMLSTPNTQRVIFDTDRVILADQDRG
ncbi:hypothetical protein [Corynebacterium sp.]|uniref:hypothetical protein n=1 Tax=Corynebacterium sp. TaxID=1720 RepID=UPI0026DA7111|nr:hypothetical protein [Corynebacterium sp.]MDO5032734.1 hypothetical protein [Corynebacterium sp.]